jgi:dipeptidyl aminopeptidase/acylaminoacyl peptidase
MPVAPYGSWKSPITSELIVSGKGRTGDIVIDGQDIYWSESRPSEGGRLIISKRAADGTVTELNPAPFNARTRVHEYGGAAFKVVKGVVFFVNFSDQRLYRLDPGIAPRPITPQAPIRFAEFSYDPHRDRLIAIREDHRNAGEFGQDAVNSIVSLALDGDGTGNEGIVLVSGNDFYSNARISPDGSRLSWLTWNHPNMPWDGTELWLADLTESGEVINPKLIAGGEEESIYQPSWSPDGLLYFVSDRTGWWNLYRLVDGQIEALAPMEAEFGAPQWVFGTATYGFANADSVICAYSQGGKWSIGVLLPQSKQLVPVETPWTDVSQIRVGEGYVAFLAGSPLTSPAVVRHDLTTANTIPVSSGASHKLDRHGYSVPGAVEFPTEGGRTAHGFFYAPKSVDYAAPEGELPPLVVLSHGGPTGSTGTSLSLQLQYWTSRGFAVLDVNYGGSTGYGRAYRERLNGQWGIVDVDDCVNGAKYLVNEGLVDGNRLAIRGWSASGYTTLAALTFRDVFKAGASHFGISDLEAMAVETHKFESRYLDRLIGRYPEDKAIYVERSPIHYVDRISCPLILFQGLEDKVVPPNQAEMMFDAVKAKGLPVAMLLFEGEQHGFRQAANIRRSLDGEWYFLSRVFGFDLPEEIEPVAIENLPG